MRREVKIGILATIVMIVIPVVVLVVLESRKREYQRKDSEFREQYKSVMVDAMSRFYFFEERLPTDWNDFLSAGVYSMSPAEFNAMIELDHNNSEGGNPVIDFQKEVFHTALLEATDNQRVGMRASGPVSDRAGGFWTARLRQ